MPPKKRTTNAKPRAKALPPKSRPVDATVRAAFLKYASPPSDAESSSTALEDMQISIPDVNRALRALRYPVPPADFFEEAAEAIGWVEFSDLATAMKESADSSDGGGAEQSGDEDEDPQREEIDKAFALFLPQGRNVSGGLREARITVADLRRIARELKDDADDGVLRLMIEEANGDGAPDSIKRGVGREDFERIMRKAGVF